eukprot:TRINITY_DN6744_c0_g1_i2.p1 TRINITY_DN6744_c0_g1~~TRINITY_DN6744_c0_g1_i2.p1  ORF type:complete len:548 (+),score=92.02 TRINITY_DN6744_c0_g1_i2:553-2196(+)
MIATDKHEVYTFGKGSSGELGQGDIKDSHLPTKVECSDWTENPNVISVSCGHAHSAAVIGTSLYTWGNNEKGQLGLGTTENKTRPAKVQGTIEKKKMSVVSCGTYHTAAITMRGELYTFGSSANGELGYGAVGDVVLVEGSSSNTPNVVKGALSNKALQTVSCGSYHTLVQTESGQIYAWGLNDQGQVGPDSSQSVGTPHHIRSGQLSSQRVRHIAAGGRHNLVALDFIPLIRVSDSVLASDLANLRKDGATSDFIVVVNDKRIEAHKIVLARAHRFESYFKDHPSAREFTCSDVRDEVFTTLIDYLYDQLEPNRKLIMEFAVELMEAAEKYGVFELKEHLEFWLSLDTPTVAFDLPSAFGDSMRLFVNANFLSDVSFDIEGQILYAHKAVLIARSPHFRGLLLGNFKESKQDRIEVLDMKYEVFLQVLKYIYTDRLEDIEPDDAVEILMAASEYMLDRLKTVMEDYLQNAVEVENVAWLYEIAERYGASQLKNYCLYFLLNEWDAVTKTETFKNLSPDVIEEIQKYHRLPKSSSKKGDKDKGCIIH